MPFMKRGDVKIYYEEFGTGYPVLLFAPGSLFSHVEDWHTAPIDPTKEYADEFRLIAMDQRNAGRSWAPIGPNDGWGQYTSDHVALLDHLGIERCHLLGQCIGGPFIMGLIQAAPERVSAAVLVQPSGRIGPYHGKSGLFDRWREQLTGHPEVTPEALDQMKLNFYTPDLCHTVTRDFVRTVQAPLLVFPGNDEAHPFAVGEEIAQLAPNAEMIAEWRSGPAREAAITRIREFLRAHVPAGAAAR
jgi:pimeloyl-ACP methyl ester carboxylesterase